MKKLFAFALLTAVLASCNTSSKVTAYFKENCPESSVKKQPNGTYKVYLKCTGLYDTAEISKYLNEGRIAFDFRKAEITGTVNSSDSIPDLQKILSSISKGIKKKKNATSALLPYK